MKKDRFVALRVIMPLLLAGAILGLSLSDQPPEIGSGFLGWDKARHAVAYGVLTWLTADACHLFWVDRRRCGILAFIVCSSFGGLIEIGQLLLTRTRSAEWGDLLANAAGAGLALLLFRLRVRRE